MPFSWRSGQPPAVHMNAYCADPAHGMIGAGPPDVLLEQINYHFHDMHNRSDLLVEWADFYVGEAPLRCDLCNAVVELPFWTRTVTPMLELGDADGRWLVCDACEQLIKERNFEAVVQRHWDQAVAQAGWLAGNEGYRAESRQRVLYTVTRLVEGTVTRDSV